METKMKDKESLIRGISGIFIILIMLSFIYSYNVIYDFIEGIKTLNIDNLIPNIVNKDYFANTDVSLIKENIDMKASNIAKNLVIFLNTFDFFDRPQFYSLLL